MPLAPGQTVLFIGDSITHAHRRPEEWHDCYRYGCGYVNHIASELSGNHPTAGWRFLNRGECGDHLPRLLDRWDSDCLAEAPALISLLVGVNDTGLPDASAERFAQQYRQLLTHTRDRLPDAKVMLLEPFGFAVPSHDQIEVLPAERLARLPGFQAVVREMAEEFDAVNVLLQREFDQSVPATTWALDGIHPSAAGHWRIGRAWLTAARDAGLLPTAATELLR